MRSSEPHAFVRVHAGSLDRSSGFPEHSTPMDPRRLTFLLELSRRGSMRAVADELGYTTSTVSEQLAVLAREAGTPLIERDGRRVRLTPAGRRLADHAVTILAAVEAARADLDPHAEPTGTVRVAGFATAIRRTLMPIARQLADAGSQVSLVIHEHEPVEAMTLLADDAVDLALVYDYDLAPLPLDDAYVVTPLWTGRWSLAVPDRHGAAPRGLARARRLRAARGRRLDRQLPQHRRRAGDPDASPRSPASTPTSPTTPTASSWSRT